MELDVELQFAMTVFADEAPRRQWHPIINGYDPAGRRLFTCRPKSTGVLADVLVVLLGGLKRLESVTWIDAHQVQAVSVTGQVPEVGNLAHCLVMFQADRDGSRGFQAITFVESTDGSILYAPEPIEDQPAFIPAVLDDAVRFGLANRINAASDRALFATLGEMGLLHDWMLDR